MDCGSLTGTLVTSIELQAETKRARWAQSYLPTSFHAKEFRTRKNHDV